MSWATNWPKKRPDRGGPGVGALVELDAGVAGPAWTAERVQRLLVDFKRGQILEQTAVAASVDGREWSRAMRAAWALTSSSESEGWDGPRAE